MISKTKLSKRSTRKNNPEIAETINAAKKNKEWNKAAQIISGSRRQYSSVNLSKIDEETKTGDTVLVLGRVLGSGNISKKVRVCALGFSENAKEKLMTQKSEIVSVLEEIKKNPKMEGVKVLR